MDVYKKIDGSPVQLGNVLSRGGEGLVYEVLSSPYSVAKIWRERNDNQTRKLEVLLNHPPSLAAGVVARFELAWPSDALYDDGGVMRGYLMPKVALEECRELVNYCIPAARRMMEQELGTRVGKQELLTIARNLSELFGCLHDAGYMIGDVNHTNVLVRPDGKLFMIDIDSVQATDPDSGDTYRCTVGKEDFTPPRLVGQRFDEVDRTAEDDLFGLSVLIFQLLMNGSHPYDPVDQTGGQGQVRRENIIRRHSPYVNLDVVQAKAMLDLQNIPDPEIREQQRKNILAVIGLGATADFDTVLGPRISSWLELESEFQELFRRAFAEEEVERPNSAQWIGTIDEIRRTVQLNSPPAAAPAPAAVARRPTAPAAAPRGRQGMMNRTSPAGPGSHAMTRQPTRPQPAAGPRPGQLGQMQGPGGSYPPQGGPFQSPYSQPPRPTRDIAGVGTRFFAWLIDSAITTAISVFLYFLLGGLGLFEIFVVSMLYGVVVFLLVALRGQSPGKLAVGIRIVRDTGHPPGLGEAFVREVIGKALFLAIPIVGFVVLAVYAITIMSDIDNQGLHDKMVKTYVVRA